MKKEDSCYWQTVIDIWASTLENLSSLLAKNKGADQPAHPRSLISVLVIRLLKSIISKLATSKISIFWVVSVTEQVGLCLTLSRRGPYDPIYYIYIIRLPNTV